MRRLVVLTMLGLTACASAPEPPAAPPIPPQAATPAQERTAVSLAIETARASLNDNETAEFKSAFVINEAPGPGPTTFVCGEIKAKNKMGAYTGWHVFVSIPGDGKNIEPSFLIDGATPRYLEEVPMLYCAHKEDRVWGAKDYAAEIEKAVRAAH